MSFLVDVLCEARFLNVISLWNWARKRAANVFTGPRSVLQAGLVTLQS
jgi:hypothetical protein